MQPGSQCNDVIGMPLRQACTQIVYILIFGIQTGDENSATAEGSARDRHFCLKVMRRPFRNPESKQAERTALKQEADCYATGYCADCK